jgi:phosphatidylserine/phosphatidylglycerophosphate/cardiolipin synthase-like enzyme
VRFRSEVVGGYQIHVVAGTNTVAFAITRGHAASNDLLGFAVERIDPTDNERYYMRGFKVFRSLIPNPEPGIVVSTFEHPVQSFVWEDFTARPDREYTYLFHPVGGAPKNLDRTADPVPITIRTEPLRTDGAHDVFFNRGVASSQAYANRFHSLTPDQQPTPEKRQDALDWLSRDLDDAILAFIAQAEKGDGLRGCFYEFRYGPVADAFRAAIDRGVDVRLIVDMKENAHIEKHKHKDGSMSEVPVESFPRIENLRTIDLAHLPDDSIIKRQARKENIAHNKFIVLVRGQDDLPTEVWTGSTNLSEGGIYGQANVGHWIRDETVARDFLAYWTLLSSDPGAQSGDSAGTARSKNAAFRDVVAALTAVPVTIEKIPPGVTSVFSPRQDLGPLHLYASLVGDAERVACITFAFGITGPFKDELATHPPDGPLCFMLLESKDRPNPRSKKPFVKLGYENNVYEAWGSELGNRLAQWVTETNNRTLGFNTHVAYIHCKFLLHDPLGPDPIVVTGSANFSADSTTQNDENMVIIRGDTRVADIYFSEFNRLWTHYYFRSVLEEVRERAPAMTDASLFLDEEPTWLEKYRADSLKRKRVAVYEKMEAILPTPAATAPPIGG